MSPASPAARPSPLGVVVPSGAPTRVLFVEDEAQAEDARHVAERLAARWQIQVVTGPEAEAAIGNDAVAAVVVGLDPLRGAALLERIRVLAPATARILLAGADNPVGIAARSAHQVVARPWDLSTMEMVLDRATGGVGMISDARVRAIIGDTVSLPSLPSALRELLTIIDRPETSAHDVIRVLQRDPAMCAKTLQLANSAFFGVPRRLTSVEQAVVYLGTNAIRAALLSSEALAALGKASDPRVAEVRGMGMLAAGLARRIAGARADDALCAAMLCDIGRLVLVARVPEEYRAVLARARAEGLSMDAAERQTWGTTHAQIGGWLLTLWGLPEAVAEAVGFTHTPFPHPSRGLDVRAVTFIAAALASEALGGEGEPALDPNWVAALGISDRLPQWRAEAEILAMEWPRA